MKNTSLLSMYILLIWILLGETAHSLDPKLYYYLYEESNLPLRSCLWHEPLKNQGPLTLSNAGKGCRVFQFRVDGTIRATTSITRPKPTDWCVNAGSGLGKDGDSIQLFRCHGKANQVWHETEDGKLQGINGKCLAHGKGQQVVLGPCEKGIRWRPQVWRPD